MQRKMHFARCLTSAMLVIALFSGGARAEQINVMNSGGFSAAYKALAPGFEQASGDTLNTAWGPSMGASPEAIPNRLQRGEAADVVIMVGYALDDLIRQGKVSADSRQDLADSRIGMVVKSGAAKPDISTMDGLRQALLNARSIAYSDSASGVYIESKLFKLLGIEDQVKGKARMIQKIPVASLVAQGEYELGFQQVSELLPVSGVDFAGKIPEQAQSITTFAAGVPSNARHPEAGRKLIRYLASPAAQDAIRDSGLDSLSSSLR